MKRETLLQTYVTVANKKWVRKQAELAGVSMSMFTDKLINDWRKANASVGVVKKKVAKKKIVKRTVK